MFYIKSISLFVIFIVSVDPAVASPQQRHLEQLRWEATMTEGSHILNKSNESKEAYLAALDELIPYECMPDLHNNLNYNGNPEDPACLSILEKIKELDAGRPIISCIEHGIDSEYCIDAYRGQRLAAGLVQSRVNGQQRTLSRQLERQLSQHREVDKKNNLDAHLKATKIINDLLKPACENAVLKAVDRKPEVERIYSPPPPGPEPTQETGTLGFSREDAFAHNLSRNQQHSRELSPMERLAAELSNDADSEEAIEGPVTHERVVTSECRQLIGETKKISSFIASPICYEHGFFSPSCIQARRLERRRLRILGQGSDTRETRGLTSF